MSMELVSSTQRWLELVEMSCTDMQGATPPRRSGGADVEGVSDFIAKEQKLSVTDKKVVVVPMAIIGHRFVPLGVGRNWP